MLSSIVFKSVVAGIAASLACGLGALPLLLPHIDPKRHTGYGYSFAAGLMVAASVYNLILPGLNMGEHEYAFADVYPMIVGILLGSLLIWFIHHRMSGPEEVGALVAQLSGERKAFLIFIAMMIHSIPEGVAVGVGYASETVYDTRLGSYIALAIAIHNIPEGLAVAIPLRASGASINRCFWAAVLTSLPQPIAAVPASMASWFFNPLMPYLMGFAAGAMIFLVMLELIPDALKTLRPAAMAWMFTFGFVLMLLVQVVI